MKQWSTKLLNKIQGLISSPYWFFGSLIATVVWMVSQYLVPHPVDPPKEFFPLIVLVYSILALWIENAMKAAQADQQELLNLQLDRMESLLNANQILLAHYRDLTIEAGRQDEVLHNLMAVMEGTIDTVEQNTERLLSLTLQQTTAGGDTNNCCSFPEGPGGTPETPEPPIENKP